MNLTPEHVADLFQGLLDDGERLVIMGKALNRRIKELVAAGKPITRHDLESAVANHPDGKAALDKHLKKLGV